MSTFGRSYKLGASPFAQPTGKRGCYYPSPYASGLVSGAARSYSFSVPVFAAGPSATQEDWNNISYEFQIVDEKGKTRTYEVAHNMALSAATPFKIYPATGVTNAEGSTFFPKGMWGFALSPRNLKQYNWQWIIDSMTWGNYTLETFSVDWTPSRGALQSGQVEACVTLDAQSLPPMPLVNSPNSVMWTATQEGAMNFNVTAQTDLVKKLKSTQSEFASEADVGIFWVRTASFSLGEGEKVVQVGTLTLNLRLTLSTPQPSTNAQLIGAWIEAGFPITPEDGAETYTTQIATASSMLGIEGLTASKKRKGPIEQQLKDARWHVIPPENARELKALKGSAEVKNAEPAAKAPAIKKLRQAKDDGKKGPADVVVTFPVISTSDFDGAVAGSTILDCAADGAVTDDPYAVFKPQFPVFYEASTQFVDAEPTVYRAKPKENEQRYQLAFYADSEALNSQALAQGGVELSFNSTGNLGKKVGACLKEVVVFPVGAAPVSEGEGVPGLQVVAGFEPGLGTVKDVSVPFTPTEEASDKITLGQALKIAAGGVAGALAVVANADSVGTLKFGACNACNQNAEVAINAFAGSASNGLGAASVDVQSTALICPENATYRMHMDTYSEQSDIRKYTELYLNPFGAAAKYGPTSFSPERLTENVARITVTGTATQLHTAMVATYGQALPADANLTASVNQKVLCTLVGSRYNPAEDPDAFFNTAVILTNPYDSILESGEEKTMYVQETPTAEDPQGYFVVNKTITRGGQLRVSDNVVGAMATLQSLSHPSCCFTVPWPDKLVDLDSGALTELKAGEKMYVALVCSTVTTYSHTISETVGSYQFCIFPQLAKGIDAAAEAEALHEYGLNLVDLNKFRGASQGAALAQTPHFEILTERRFSIQNTVPADSDESTTNSDKLSGAKKALKAPITRKF